jgi:hypothetical protein
MLGTDAAARILGPECELTEDQIGMLLSQLYLLALVVLDEMSSDAGPVSSRENAVAQ